MRAYRETFKRHRLLFCLPPVLAALAAAALTFTTPKTYASYASLWVDNGPTAGSSLGNPAQPTSPSSAEQTVLNELLATQSFDLDVGNASPLRQQIASAGGSPQTVAGSIAAAVASGVSSSTPGPQVLQLSFSGSSPQVARSTLGLLLTHLQSAASGYLADFGKSAVAYYQGQVRTATAAQVRAKQAAAAYLAAHPKASAQSDSQYASLVAQLGSATSQLGTATSALNQAQAQADGASSGASVHVIDQPSVPTGPTSSKKKALMEIVGAMLAGILISIIAIVAITPGGDSRWDSELSGEDPKGLGQVRAAPATRVAPVASAQPTSERPAPARPAPARSGPAPTRPGPAPAGRRSLPALQALPPISDERPNRESA
jgi:uncharacterized protein involved in exopolysaccharide biosynthesis